MFYFYFLSVFDDLIDACTSKVSTHRLLYFLLASRNVPLGLTKTLLDLMNHFVSIVLLMTFLIVLFIFQSEVDVII